jgi:uncharacterized protein
MEPRDEQTIVSLLDQDPELKKCYDEHLEFEKQLAEYQHKHHLTAEEEVERQRPYDGAARQASLIERSYL